MLLVKHSIYLFANNQWQRNIVALPLLFSSLNFSSLQFSALLFFTYSKSSSYVLLSKNIPWSSWISSWSSSSLWLPPPRSPPSPPWSPPPRPPEPSHAPGWHSAPGIPGWAAAPLPCAAAPLSCQRRSSVSQCIGSTLARRMFSSLGRLSWFSWTHSSALWTALSSLSNSVWSWQHLQLCLLLREHENRAIEWDRWSF